jgi:replicative DNA helicase
MNEPHNLEAEKTVIVTILRRPSWLRSQEVCKLEADDFYSPAHSEMFSCFKELDQEDLPISFSSLQTLLNERGSFSFVGGRDSIADLRSGVVELGEDSPVIAAKTVKTKSLLRRLIWLCQQIVESKLPPAKAGGFSQD